MSYLQKLQEIKKKHRIETQKSEQNFVPFSKKDMAIEIWYEELGSKIWLCSNEGKVQQIQKDDPSSVCFTYHELNELYEKRGDPELYKIILYAKKIFNPAKVIKDKNE